MIVLLATFEETRAEAERRLRALGADELELRATGDDRVVLGARFADDSRASRVVAQLRDEGYFATDRPEGGGHLSAWRRHNAPIDVAGRAVVCFPWAEFDRPPGTPIIEIDPARGFGTGSHPSTALLLGELGARLRGGESVLDVGCGSGVLALCAATLGAASVTAIDNDPRALAATRANARHNRVGESLEVSEAPVGSLSGRFDVVLANIAAVTLIELAGAIAPRLAPGGWLGLSGLSPAQLSLVERAYRPLVSVAHPTLDEWAATVLTSPPETTPSSR